MQFKKLVPWIVLVLTLSAFVFMAQETGGSKRPVVSELNFSDFLHQVEENRVHDVTISGSEITGHFMDNRSFQIGRAHV